MKGYNMLDCFRTILVCTVLAVLMSLSANVTFAQAVASFQDNNLMMGKTIRLTVDVPVPNDSAKVQFPLIDENLMRKNRYATLLNDTLEVLTKYSRTFESHDGRNWYRYNLSIQAFDSGKYELPPFHFIVNGQPVTSNQLELNVIPVKVTAEDNIEPSRDIVEPYEVNPNPEEMEEPNGLLWWLIPLAVIMLALVIYLYSRFKKTGSFLMFAKPQPPYMVALSKLKKLQAQNLPQKGKTKEYYTKLTDILRSYINRQFNIKTFEKTSGEIIEQVREDEQLSKYEEMLKSIFETADFVKFAKVQPSVIENSRCITEAERFVEVSHPDIEERKGGDK